MRKLETVYLSGLDSLLRKGVILPGEYYLSDHKNLVPGLVAEYFKENKDTVFFFAITNSQRQLFRQTMTKLGLHKNVFTINKVGHKNPNTGRLIYMYYVDQMKEGNYQRSRNRKETVK